MSPNITLRSLTEHCPSSRYNNNFGIKNIGSISHLLNFDNINATTLWGGNLRDYERIKNGEDNDELISKEDIYLIE